MIFRSHSLVSFPFKNGKSIRQLQFWNGDLTECLTLRRMDNEKRAVNGLKLPDGYGECLPLSHITTIPLILKSMHKRSIRYS